MAKCNFYILSILLLALMFGCKKEPAEEPRPEKVPVSSVTLDKTALELVEGNSQNLIATVSPSNASNKSVSWKSSNTAVASVSEEGKVTAIKAGTAIITVTTADGGKTATCRVTIKAKTGVNADIDDWGDGNNYSGSVD